MVLAAPKGPLVKLDDKHYKLVDKMDALTQAVPSLIHATSLTVKGPVRFQAGTSFAGDVLVTNGAAAEIRRPTSHDTCLRKAAVLCKAP